MIGMRLKEERQRLGFTQPNFAKVADASKRTLIDWEKGVSAPNGFQLSALALIGVDIQYIITGYRSSTALPSDEAFMLEKIRQADAETRNKILMLLLGGDIAPSNKSDTLTESIVNSGNGAQSGNTVNNNSSTVHGDQYNAQNQTFHRKESGFTDLPFSVAAALCAFTAWALGWLANHIGLTNKALSFDVGVPAILLWVLAIILMVFATEKRKMMKKDKLTVDGR